MVMIANDLLYEHNTSPANELLDMNIPNFWFNLKLKFLYRVGNSALSVFYSMFPSAVFKANISNLICDTAIFHDILEDSPLEYDKLIEILKSVYTSKTLSKRFIAAVQAITRNPNENYDDYIKRCKKNRMARIVKIADLIDNLNMARLDKIGNYEIDRLFKYKKALDFLLED